jgi:hypothetical protein
VLRLNATRSAIADESAPRALRLFRGEQRAIGELMMISTDDPGSARHESMGYVQFCARLGNDAAFAQWFHRLLDGVDDIAAVKRSDHSRLIVLHNRLMDLIEFLDPECSRVPANRRDRLALPSAQQTTADGEQAR